MNKKIIDELEIKISVLIDGVKSKLNKVSKDIDKSTNDINKSLNNVDNKEYVNKIANNLNKTEQSISKHSKNIKSNLKTAFELKGSTRDIYDVLESMKHYRYETNEINQKMDELKQKYANLKNSNSGNWKELDNLKNKLQNLNSDIRQIEEAGGEASKYQIASQKNLEYRINNINELLLSQKNQMSEIRQQMISLSKTPFKMAIMEEGTKFINVNEKAMKNIDSVTGKIKVLKKESRNFANKKFYVSADMSSLDKAKKYISMFLTNVKQIPSEIGERARESAEHLRQNLVNKIKSIPSKTLSILKKIPTGIKSMVNKIKSSTKDVTKNITKGFNNGIKSVKRFALSLLTIRGAYTIISRAVSNYLQYDDELSKSLQNSWNALGSLLAPALEYVANLFNQLVSIIVKFIQAISGIDLVARANAKGLKKQTEETKKLASANRQLSSIDDIETLSSDKNSSDDNSFTPITIKDVDIDLDKLKDKIFNSDFYAIGYEIGQKITDAICNIDWNKIQDTFTKLAGNIANFFNGLVDGTDWSVIGENLGNLVQTLFQTAYKFMSTFKWDNLGKSIATGINSAMKKIDFKLIGKTIASKLKASIDFLYGFVETFDWSNFGKSISDTIMGWWNGIDWKQLAQTLSDSITGLLDSIMSFIENLDWEQIGNDIWIFISSIDWTGIVTKLFMMLGELLAGLTKLLYGFIKDSVKSVSDFFSKKFEEAGGDIVQGLFNGIIEIFSGINDWINEHIFKPFIDGFKKIFEIHSPSKVMMELGNFIVSGFLEPINNIWDKAKDIFINLKDNISNTFKDIVTKIKDAFSVSTIKQHFSNILQTIKNVFSSVPNWFKTQFTNAWQNVKNVFSTGGKIFDGIKDGIASVFTTIVNKIISGINRVISIPFKSINNTLQKIHDVNILGLEPFKFITKFDVPKIPELESGNVAKQKTLAIFGEYANARNNPEITSPVSLMADTFRSVLDSFDFGGTRIDTLKIDVAGDNFYQGAVDYINSENSRNGVSIIKEV